MATSTAATPGKTSNPTPSAAPAPTAVQAVPPPPPVVATAPSAVPSAPSQPPHPRIGGVKKLGSDWIYFSGGGSLQAHRVAEPSSVLAFRPDTDLRSIMRVEEACTKPLEEAKRIDEGVCPVTFTQWTNAVKCHFVDNGLDSIAYVLKPKVKNAALPDINSLSTVERECNEYYLFSEWGVLSKDDMDAWDAALKTSACDMDSTNNGYARRFLRASVGPVLRERIDRELPIDVSGARLLFFIIRKLQAVSAVSGRQLVEELQQIKLTSVAGCHVQECARKIHNVCTKIVGLGSSHVPTDLAMLVSQCFDTTTVQAFDLEVTKIQNDLDADPSSHTWTSILDHLNAKFDTLYLTKRWPPLSSEKTAVASGFAVQLAEVKKGLNEVKSALHKTKTPPAPTGSTRDLSNVECHYCHKKGHYKSDCPSLANKSTNGSVPTSSAGKGEKPKHWTRTAPADTEPHTKTVTVEGKSLVFKWCKTCKRWRSGPKAHTSDEHKKRTGPATTIATGNAFQSDVEGINFGLFPAEARHPIPGGFLERFFELHPPPDDDLVREGEIDQVPDLPNEVAGLW